MQFLCFSLGCRELDIPHIFPITQYGMPNRTDILFFWMERQNVCVGDGGSYNCPSDRDYVLLKTLCITHKISFLFCKGATKFQLDAHQPVIGKKVSGCIFNSQSILFQIS